MKPNARELLLQAFINAGRPLGSRQEEFYEFVHSAVLSLSGDFWHNERYLSSRFVEGFGVLVTVGRDHGFELTLSFKADENRALIGFIEASTGRMYPAGTINEWSVLRISSAIVRCYHASIMGSHLIGPFDPKEFE